MKLRFTVAFVVCMAAAPLLFADEPAHRVPSIEERLLEAKIAAVVTVFEKAHVLKFEAELERRLQSESADKTDELKFVAAGKRIAALDIAIGKLRDTAKHDEAELLGHRARARRAKQLEPGDAPKSLHVVRVYKLNQLDDNVTERAFAKMFNKALEGAGLKALESPEHIERGSGWLKVKAAEDQVEVVDQVMFLHDAPK